MVVCRQTSGKMSNINYFFRNSHYNIIRVLLSVSGLWPFDTLSKRCAIYLAMLLILGSGFLFQMLGIMEVWQDTFELVDSLPLLLFSVVIILKMIYAVYTLPKIKLLLTKMQKHYLSPKSKQEINIQNSHSQYGRVFGYLYTIIVMSHSALFVCMTLLTKFIRLESIENATSSNKVQGAQPGLPYRVKYMIDVDTYYIPIFIHTATCEVSFTFLLVIFDVFYLTVVEHCCGLFAALRYRLENAYEYEKNDDNLMKDKSYFNTAYSIRRHAEAVQFVAIVESVYCLPLLIQVGCTVLVISVLGYQVITNMENVNQLLKHASYLNALLLNTFFENWQGQKIIDSSERVFKSAYNAEWYNMPIEARKLLIMVMVRSKRPSILTIGKLTVLSYVTFNAVLRMSSSYFMLLRSM